VTGHRHTLGHCVGGFALALDLIGWRREICFLQPPGVGREKRAKQATGSCAALSQCPQHFGGA